MVLVDNGRSDMLGTEFQDMLRCIRCGACINHCPVYAAIGGHAYGWVYPGPMGAVLTPQLIGIDEGAHLPNASTFCGRCESVCPMNIPLPKMMRHWRERDYRQKPAASFPKLALRAWAFLAKRPRFTGSRWAPASGCCRCWPGANAASPACHSPAPGQNTASWQRPRRAASNRFGRRASGKGHAMVNAPKSARAEVLAKVRARLGVRGDEPGRRGLAQERLRNPKANLIPERAQKPRAELIKLFQAMLEKSGAKVTRVRALKALPEAIAAQLRENNLPMRLRLGADPVFDGLRAEPGMLELHAGPAEASDEVGLSHAVAGAAETGTLFLVSGPDNPSTLNFLPETHIAVISASDIAGSYEDCWAKLRKSPMPRTVNLISGPSRTADIEQTIVMGAHGPRNLLVFITGS